MKFDLSGRWLPIVRRLPVSSPVADVALTFDDGPTEETTPALLDLLAAHQATATFFLSGVRVMARPDLVGAVVAAGHAVYAHGWEHIRLDRVAPDQLIADMARCEEILSRFRPTPVPYLIRLPYAGGYRNPRVHATLRRLWPQGQIAHWSGHFDDPGLAAGCATAGQVEAAAPERVRQALNRPGLPGTVLLMHELAYDIDSPVRAEVSLTLTRHILAELSQRGLRCVPMQPHAHPPAFSRWLLR